MEKILFLTSSPLTVPGGPLNNANGFVDKLKNAAEKYKKALFVTAFPDDIAETKCFAEGIKEEAAFFAVSQYYNISYYMSVMT